MRERLAVSTILLTTCVVACSDNSSSRRDFAFGVTSRDSESERVETPRRDAYLLLIGRVGPISRREVLVGALGARESQRELNETTRVLLIDLLVAGDELSAVESLQSQILGLLAENGPDRYLSVRRSGEKISASLLPKWPWYPEPVASIAFQQYAYSGITQLTGSSGGPKHVHCLTIPLIIPDSEFDGTDSVSVKVEEAFAQDIEIESFNVSVLPTID